MNYNPQSSFVFVKTGVLCSVLLLGACCFSAWGTTGNPPADRTGPKIKLVSKAAKTARPPAPPGKLLSSVRPLESGGAHSSSRGRSASTLRNFPVKAGGPGLLRAPQLFTQRVRSVPPVLSARNGYAGNRKVPSVEASNPSLPERTKGTLPAPAVGATVHAPAKKATASAPGAPKPVSTQNKPPVTSPRKPATAQAAVPISTPKRTVEKSFDFKSTLVIHLDHGEHIDISYPPRPGIRTASSNGSAPKKAAKPRFPARPPRAKKPAPSRRPSSPSPQPEKTESLPGLPFGEEEVALARVEEPSAVFGFKLLSV